MKKKQKHLEYIAEDLKRFLPEYGQHFACPTCLAIIPLNENHRITEAHIIPKSAGGGLKTFLCAKCNSHFGANQDKWMGEWVRLARERDSIFNTKKQRGYFEINNQRVGGIFRESPDGNGIDIAIWRDRTSPDILRKIESRPQQMSISIHIPVLENFDLVCIGLLTSAYLTWFRELGYSWVFQRQLDIVRQQILNPTEKILPNNFVKFSNDPNLSHSWIGVADIGETFAVVSGVSNAIVLFPPADEKLFYETLALSRLSSSKLKAEFLQFSNKTKSISPIGVLYRNRMAIIPNGLRDGSLNARMVYFPGDGRAPQSLTKITKEEYSELSEQADVVAIDIQSK